MPRRAEQPITIRSDRAARRLALLTRGGRSQASVIEEALDRMPLPPDAEAELRTRLEAILDRPGAVPPAMTEFDAREYDERGDPRR
ncbi:MAG: hypothetical protein MUC64_18990 [Rubritepida sp.]|jgi:antitoxin VapB|nr:hypothetical protein [Rubritepida sp.]